MSYLLNSSLRKFILYNTPILKRFNSSNQASGKNDKIIEKEESELYKETHTGQKWEPDDFRMARFQYKERQFNQHFAIDLIADTPPIPSKKRVTVCDGGGGPLGHPTVFINLDQPGNHSCGYCGLRFYLDNNKI